MRYWPFNSLFKQQESVNFSGLGVDMHSHLIPGVDDGSASFDDTIKMITGLQELGFCKFVTTPHAMPGVYENTKQNIDAAAKKLNFQLTQQLNLTIQAAAEYYVDDDFPQRIRDGETPLTFGNNYVLIEMSMNSKSMNLDAAIFELTTRGYQPVLAHVERYPYLFHNGQLNNYEQLRDADVLLQVNLRSFIGNYGEIQRKIARKLAEAAMIDFLGTDIHNPAQLDALKIAMEDKVVQQLLRSGKLKNNLL